MGFSITITFIEAVNDASLLVTVIVVSPLANGLTIPFSIVAIFGLLLVHIGLSNADFSGDVISFSSLSVPMYAVISSFSKKIFFAGNAVTTTLQEASLFPSSLIAFISTVPFDRAVTTPFSTVATFLSLVVHFIF